MQQSIHMSDVIVVVEVAAINVYLVAIAVDVNCTCINEHMRIVEIKCELSVPDWLVLIKIVNVWYGLNGWQVLSRSQPISF